MSFLKKSAHLHVDSFRGKTQQKHSNNYMVLQNTAVLYMSLGNFEAI